jgi:hypothetical protein
MGSGKTRIVCDAIKDDTEELFVILCRVNATPTWTREIRRWLGEDIPVWVADGTAQARANIWRCRSELRARFIITTYEAFVRDTKMLVIPKDLNVICDEPHRYIRNKKNVTFKTLRSHTLHSKWVVMVSGTPARSGPQDMWTYLNISDRKHFPSFWSFVSKWTYLIESPFGMEIGGPRNKENFKEEVLARYTMWITDAEVAPYLPKKHRIPVPLVPSDEQIDLLEQIEDKMRLEIPDNRLILTPSTLTQLTRYRQILCCPKIINPEWGYGTCLEEIVQRIDDVGEPRCVIYTPFTAAIPYIKELLWSKLGQPIFTFQGGMDRHDLEAGLKAFNECDQGNAVVSVSYAESFEFPRSKYGFFCGFDWSWVNNEQAEDRMRRLISEHQLLTYFYFYHEGYADEQVRAVCNDDTSNIKQMSPASLQEMFPRRQ